MATAGEQLKNMILISARGFWGTSSHEMPTFHTGNKTGKHLPTILACESQKWMTVCNVGNNMAARSLPVFAVTQGELTNGEIRFDHACFQQNLPSSPPPLQLRRSHDPKWTNRASRLNLPLH